MSDAWFSDPRFGLGLAIAVAGWLINFQADSILIRLRSDGVPGYKIPRGGAFRYVSAANYFGEIVLWTGWAVMRSEEHTSEIQSLMRISYAVFCLKKKKKKNNNTKQQ